MNSWKRRNWTILALVKVLPEIKVKTEAGLFYRVIGEISGYSLEGEHQLLGLVEELSKAKKHYDRVASALKDVWDSGYGVVAPKLDELILEEPEIFKQGSRFGVRLKASAPSIHMIRADIQTEVSPLVGTEKQSEELLNYLISELRTTPPSCGSPIYSANRCMTWYGSSFRINF